jgi:hypothetical protein
MHPLSGKLIILLPVLLSGCSRAEASSLDASNPVHCTIVLTAFEQIAQKMGNDKAARSLGVRASWYGEQSRALAEDQRSEAALNNAYEKLAAAPQAAEEIGMECQRRQDQHPDWQAQLAFAREQVAHGKGSERAEWSSPR